MKNISIYLALSLMITTLIVGLAFGYFISPKYQQTMLQKEEEMGLGKADKNIDLRYINAMATHHKGAIELANQISDKTKRQELKTLGAAIKEGEPKLIEELYQWKKDWYQDGSSFKDPIVVNLGNADEKIDLRFLNALIAHHEAGIEMTTEIKTKSTRAEILNNADSVEEFLTESVKTLKMWRKEWYKI